MEVSETGVAGGIVQMMGILGLIVVFVSQTRINTANYYLGAANLKSFGERVFWIRMPDVAWQGVLVTAWVALAMTHVLITRGKCQEHGMVPDNQYGKFNNSGLIAWVVATLIGVVMLQLGTMNPDLAGLRATWGPILTALSATGVEERGQGVVV